MREKAKFFILILCGALLGAWLNAWLQREPSEPLPVISLPATLQAQPHVYFEVQAKSQGSEIRWVPDNGLSRFPGKLADDNAGFFVAAKIGTYRVRAFTATRGWLPWSRAVPSDLAECVVTVGDAPPEPTPPTPPVPPKPPSVNPFAGSPAGLRVLVLFDGKVSLPKDQQAILTSTKLRAFLDANCAKVGNWPEYRLFDKGTPLANESALWRDTVARGSWKTLPWLLIGNGPAGWEGPLPENSDAVIARVQPFVGQQRSELDLPWPKQRLPPRRETLWTLGV